MKTLSQTKQEVKKRGRISRLASCLVVTYVLLLIPSLSSAQEIFEFYKGTRQLGMGGAYTGVVDDSTALLTNPAGLGKVRDFTFTLADPQLEGSMTDTDIANSGNAGQMLEAQGLLDNLNKNKGIPWHLLGQVFPSIVGPNFGFGVLGKKSYDAMVDSTGKNFRLDYTRDYATALGFCLRFFGGVVKVGVAGRLVDRTEVHKTMLATVTNLNLDDLQSEGLGGAGDAGLIITIPVAWLPSLSATARDIGSTSYTMSNGIFSTTTSRPMMTPSTIDAGISFFPILSNHIRMSVTGEYHDVATSSQEQDQMRRVHAGLEINLADFLFLRGGLNQRYWTAGIEISTERFQLQAASYGEEIGTYPTNLEDRRWVGSFGLRF